jgi:hypothetical protein
LVFMQNKIYYIKRSHFVVRILATSLTASCSAVVDVFVSETIIKGVNEKS